MKATLFKYKAAYEINGQRPALTLLREMQPGLDSFVVESVKIEPRQGAEAAGGEKTDGLKPAEYDLSDAVYEAVPVPMGENGLIFEYSLPEGLKIRKKIELKKGNWHFNVNLEFTNTGTVPLSVTYRLRTAAGIEAEQLPPNSVSAVMGIRRGPSDYAVIAKGASKVAKEPYVNTASGLHWAGMNNRYFLAVALAENESMMNDVTAGILVDNDLAEAKGRWAKGTIARSVDNAADRERLAKSNARVTIGSSKIALAKGQTETQKYRFVLAPKVTSVLTSYNCHFQDLQEFSWFKGISRVLVQVLDGIHKVIPSYGLAILLLTLLVKLALHYFTKKSQVSLVRMQQLQPELQKLKDKYGHEKKRLGAEQWALYKKYGINPMSGCWPVLFQMPVFIALFGALRGAFTLRQASFLWIKDLSQPDTVTHLPFDCPSVAGN